MSIIKRDYELSIWKVDGLKEQKLVIIGNPLMFQGVKAQQITLKRNINGTKTLTFSLYTSYLDENGIVKDNPFYRMITNNTKLKLYWKDKWYEFLVKTIVEDSENKKVSYTAEDAFIIELSKRGFGVELSTELENNQGTIVELGNKILENSGWTVDKKNSIIKPQFVKDVVVRLVTLETIFATQKIVINPDETIKVLNVQTEIPKGSEILGFYSSLLNEEPLFQFYYLKDKNYEVDDDNLIKNCPLYNIDNQSYVDGIPTNIEKKEVTSYQGKKLIRIQKNCFNNVLQNYVKYYRNPITNETLLGYEETKYLTDNSVNNLITNGTNFTSDIGWYSMDDNSIELFTYPNAQEIVKTLSAGKDASSQTYLKVNFNSFRDWQFYNSGFEDNKIFLDSLYKGQKFVVKIKYGYLLASTNDKVPIFPKVNKQTKIPNSGFRISLCSYSYGENGEIVVDKEFFSTSLQDGKENVFRQDGDYFVAICTNKYNYSKKDLETIQLGVFFALEKNDNSIMGNNPAKYNYFLGDCQIFEYVQKNEQEFYKPDDLIDGEVKILYNYFPEANSYKNLEDIVYSYRGYEKQNFENIYYDDYRQIRTIEGKESNYFNLIQSLCETFECWADFDVPHDSLGYIKKDSSGNFIKKIVFKAYIGKENWAGFRQGVNLKKISRTLESSQIVTKTIVKTNNNEFAENGFCAIAQATENPSGENFIYDFSFYEQTNTIDVSHLTDDLYGTYGVYSQLKKINKNLAQISEQQAALSLELIHLNSELEIKLATNSELSTQIATAKKDFKTYSGMPYQNYLKMELWEQEELLELSGVSDCIIIIIRNTLELNKIQSNLNDLKKKKEVVKKELDNLTLTSEELTKQKEKIIFTFENKYSSYIHEGVWVSEEYTDSNLYYVDAKNVAATSAKPQVTYNIEVIDISCLEEFLNYNFDIGDKTYVVDPEFLGYIYKDGLMTPRQQEVVITELEEVLESPENNKIVVQNYKTQFEDLFQRIVATSQQLQLKEGEYSRAASAFSSSGLSQQITQDSLNASDGFYLKNNSINWDSSGFISTNLANKREFLKIHNGSMFITNDGGVSWNSAITGKGIDASYIYAGQLDAGVVNIVSELKKDENDKLEYALTLDPDGLSMYSYVGKKTPRIRLGKILSKLNEETEELYGLQLYNNKGEQTFRTDSDGNITMTGTIHAKNGMFNGSIYAANGVIGGWTIDTNTLTHKTRGAIDAIISSSNLSSNYRVNSYSGNDWRLIFGINGISGNFGVTSKGNLYANGVDIKDGNISFGDVFKITSNSSEQVVSYGLNISLNPENQDKQIVIESDDRVIGIREKETENGTTKWVWKTILGDLTNATLGGKPVSDYGIKGYGLCTENGLFSGTIISTKGKIGSWNIGQNYLYHITEPSNYKDIFLGKGGDEDRDLFTREYEYTKYFPSYEGYVLFSELEDEITEKDKSTIDFTQESDVLIYPFVLEDDDDEITLYIEEILKDYSYSFVFSGRAAVQLKGDGVEIEKRFEITDLDNPETFFSVKIDEEAKRTNLKFTKELKNKLTAYIMNLDNTILNLQNFIRLKVKITCSRLKEERSIVYKSRNTPFDKDDLAKEIYNKSFNDFGPSDLFKKLAINTMISEMSNLHTLQTDTLSKGVIKIFNEEDTNNQLKFILTDKGKINFIYKEQKEGEEEEEAAINIITTGKSFGGTLLQQSQDIFGTGRIENSLKSFSSASETGIFIHTGFRSLTEEDVNYGAAFAFIYSPFINKGVFYSENSQLGAENKPWIATYSKNYTVVVNETEEVPLHYTPGKTITYNEFLSFAGFLNSTGKGVYFTIPLNKTCPGCTSVELEGTLRLRASGTTDGKYIDFNLGDGSTKIPNTEITYNINTVYVDGIGINVTISFSSTPFGTNIKNVPITASFDILNEKVFKIHFK